MTQLKNSFHSAITFEVDGELPKINCSSITYSPNEIINAVLEDNIYSNRCYIHSSLNGENNLSYLGKDAFFQTILQAFCHHKSLIFTPDMIWLKILQTYSRHINADPERYRHLTSVEKGKCALVLKTYMDLFSADADWGFIIDELQSMLAKNVKERFTKNLVADFSTTTSAEKIASQITIFDAMKSYFEIIVIGMVCGIPKITLQGSPEDWESILVKLDTLRIYEGLQDWIDELRPILKEFVNASKGNVNRNFWREIVLKRHPEDLCTAGCLPQDNPYLDGWILKFYPFDHNEKTLKTFSPDMHMKSELATLDWTYIEEHTYTPPSVYPMELWAGFLGTRIYDNGETYMPEIGWFARLSDTDKQIAENINIYNDYSKLHLRINSSVPTFLKEIKNISQLTLDFEDSPIEIPSWMDDLDIEELHLYGKGSREKMFDIISRFKRVYFH